jgi:hypothetical protein
MSGSICFLKASTIRSNSVLAWNMSKLRFMDVSMFCKHCWFCVGVLKILYCFVLNDKLRIVVIKWYIHILLSQVYIFSAVLLEQVNQATCVAQPQNLSCQIICFVFLLIKFF